MKERKHGDGAQVPAEQDGPAPGGPTRPAPEAGGRSWGKGAATALERLRRNDYRGHPGEPGKEGPASD